MTRLEVLYEAAGLPRVALPPELAEAYGGGLGFDGPCVFANFVQTIDGVVAMPDVPQSNKLISDERESDRFVMGLLRAYADAVLIGAGTLRASKRGLWTAERAYPPAAEAFAELRRGLGKPPKPQRVVLTATGNVPPAHPLFEEGALVLTTEQGAAALDGRLPSASTVVDFGPPIENALAILRERGHDLILVEVGPHAFGSLLDWKLVDELFLTVSPLIAGRDPSERRLGLVEGFEAMPDEDHRGELLSVRRDDAFLFLRYRLR